MNENSIKAANTFSVDHLIDCCSSKFKLVIWLKYSQKCTCQFRKSTVEYELCVLVRVPASVFRLLACNLKTRMVTTSIFSSMSCLAWSICCGEPRMINSLKLGSPLGGGCREISTKAPVCWLMDLTFSPPRPITSPHLWAGIEKVISPPGGPHPPCPPPLPLLPAGMPGGPGGPCRWRTEKASVLQHNTVL